MVEFRVLGDSVHQKALVVILDWLIDAAVFLYSMVLGWLPIVEIPDETIVAAGNALSSINFFFPVDQVLIITGLWLALVLPTLIIWAVRFIKKFLPW